MLTTKDEKGEPVKIMHIVTAKEPGARRQLDYKLPAALGSHSAFRALLPTSSRKKLPEDRLCFHM